MEIVIDGEQYTVDHVDRSFSSEILTIPRILVKELTGPQDFWWLAPSSEVAGDAVVQYWMDEIDIGGQTQAVVLSMQGYMEQVSEMTGLPITDFPYLLEVLRTYPEVFLTSPTTGESVVESASSDLVDELGFVPEVAYRNATERDFDPGEFIGELGLG